jgi:hypothetical protein
VTAAEETKPKATVSREPEDTREVPIKIEFMSAEPDGQGRLFIPDRGTIHYRRKFGEQWRVQVFLSGPRVLSNGLISHRSRADRTYWMPEECDPGRYPSRREVPAFLQEFVTHYWPAVAR